MKRPALAVGGTYSRTDSNRKANPMKIQNLLETVSSLLALRDDVARLERQRAEDAKRIAELETLVSSLREEATEAAASLRELHLERDDFGTRIEALEETDPGDLASSIEDLDGRIQDLERLDLEELANVDFGNLESTVENVEERMTKLEEEIESVGSLSPRMRNLLTLKLEGGAQ